MGDFILSNLSRIKDQGSRIKWSVENALDFENDVPSALPKSTHKRTQGICLSLNRFRYEFIFLRRVRSPTVEISSYVLDYMSSYLVAQIDSHGFNLRFCLGLFTLPDTDCW